MVGESQETVGAGVGGGSSGANKMPTLEEYGTNLTKQAEEVNSRLSPALGLNFKSRVNWIQLWEGKMKLHGLFKSLDDEQRTIRV